MLTPIDRMRSDMVKDSLRRTYQNAINMLIAAGVDEEDARTAATDALERTLMEVTNEA